MVIVECSKRSQPDNLIISPIMKAQVQNRDTGSKCEKYDIGDFDPII